MKSGHLRDNALQQVSSHAPNWKQRAMQELRWMRSGRISRNISFTFEKLLPDLEYLIGYKIPSPNLMGSIALDAIRTGLIEPTGIYVHTTDEQKHARKAAEYRWKPLNGQISTGHTQG